MKFKSIGLMASVLNEARAPRQDFIKKYYGDVLLQKTYIANFFTGKQVPNRGECECYLLKGHHEAIIHDKDILTLITD